MANIDNNQALSPPGLVSCLQAGFDTTTNNVALLIFPVILDLFLWLGPRLSLRTLIEQLSVRMFSIPGMDAPELADFVAMSREIWSQAAQRVNLFGSLRSYPVGVSSLMATSLPLQSPLGQPLRWELFSAAGIVGSWLALTILGLLIGALYYSLVADVTQAGKADWVMSLRRWPRRAFQVVLLALFWLALLAAFSIPCLCIVMVLSLGGLTLGQIGLMVYIGVMFWVFFPLIFAPLSIFNNEMNVWPSVRLSVRMMRWTMPRSTLFFMIVFLLDQGLDMIWRVPQETTWLTLVGIMGHAFITTGLLAGVFTYFQRTQDWLKQLANLPRPAGWAA